MCLMEKIHILDKLGSGMSHGAVDCEFDAEEPTIKYTWTDPHVVHGSIVQKSI